LPAATQILRADGDAPPALRHGFAVSAIAAALPPP